MTIYESIHTAAEIDAAVNKVGILKDFMGNSELTKVTNVSADTLLDIKVYYTATGSETSTLTNIPDIFKKSDANHGPGNCRIFNIINTGTVNGSWWGHQFILGVPGIYVRKREGTIFTKWYPVFAYRNSIVLSNSDISNNSISLDYGINYVFKDVVNTLEIKLPDAIDNNSEVLFQNLKLSIHLHVGDTPNITFTNTRNIPVLLTDVIEANTDYIFDITSDVICIRVNVLKIPATSGATSSTLPNGYQPLQYVQKTLDYSFIETGITPSEVTDAIEFDVELSSIRNNDRYAVPASGTIFIQYINGSGQYAYTYNGQWVSTAINATTSRTTFKVDYKNKKVTVNGTEKTISGSSSNVAGSTLKLFGRSDGTTGPIGKIYGIKFWRNETLIFDLKPCISPVGEVCFYDTVASKIYYCTGVNKYIAGPSAEN